MPRIAAAKVRLAVLAALVVGHLPVPIVHSHAALTASDATRLARHVAVFHGGKSTDSTRSHVHVVPSVFFAGGGLADATGEDVPDAGTWEVPPLEVVQLDVPFAVPQAYGLFKATAPITLRCIRPAHFLATFSDERDLGGLLGVCLC